MKVLHLLLDNSFACLSISSHLSIAFEGPIGINVYRHWLLGLVPFQTNRMVVLKGGDGFLISPGVVSPTRRVVQNCRRLVKRTSRCVRLGRQSGTITPKKPESVLRMRFSRARVYHFNFPKKAFTPSHSVYFLLIFRCFECEGFVFQAFTRAVNACEGFKEKPFHWKNRWKSGANR